MVSKEFFKMVDVVAEEKGVSQEVLLDAFKKAMINAYKRKYGNSSARVEIKPEKHEIMLYSQHLVVSELTFDPEQEMAQILLADAKKISSKYKVGDIVEQPINVKEFGRMAVSIAKQVFNQSMKNIEKEKAFEYYKKYEGEMLNVDVIMEQESFFTVSLGDKTTTILPKKDLLPGDNLHVGDKVLVYVTGVEQGTKGPKIFISRQDKNFLSRLLEHNVPEVAAGTVVIMGIAREPGVACKIGIASKDPNVEAIGSCVGEKGSRIKEVVKALNGEAVQLFEWNEEDPKALIANSLAPAKVLDVIQVYRREKSCIAIVDESQFSLAVGKAGLNAKLACQATGWSIDIKTQEDAEKAGYDF